jgi:hypothetical protein
MLTLRRYSVFLSLSIVVLCACKASTQAPAPTPLTTIAAPQGGKIVYGSVSGATTQSAVLTSLLARVHTLCGEKPQIGRVFQFTGTNSVGVFFTVTDHPEGNLPLAGMVIARSTGPNQADGAMLYDLASRFGQTVNPMLQQLSGVWQQGGQAAASSAGAASAAGGSVPAASSNASSPAGAASASSVPLHPVTAPDNSASLSVPNGWTVDPQSYRGAIIVRGPNGEQLGLEMNRGGIDPTNPFRARSDARGQLEGPGTVVYAFRGDLTKEFVPVFQAWRQAGGQGPAKIQVDKIQEMPEPQGVHGVMASGQMDPDGKGMQFFSDLMTVTDPTRDYGSYSVTLSHALLPLAITDKEKPMLNSIISTYKPNMQVVNAENSKLIQQKQQSDQQTLAAAQARVNQIKQIGANATARMNTTEAANSAEQASWNAGQTANAQNGQGFSNYLLDQSVVQNNSTGAHGTLWNNAADGLVQFNPNKYSYVSNPNLIPGTDF